MESSDIIRCFYPEDSPLRQLLLKHSAQVRDKALAILDLPENTGLPIDRTLVSEGAMLHDIGIFRCHAPSILCAGTEPYLTHGVIGAALLRQFGEEHQLDLEPFARICERHTGSGITSAEIRTRQLPLPPQDFLPETLEEQLICLADKFFSKSGDLQEKSLPSIRRAMEKFGQDSLLRFDQMCRKFSIFPCH